MDPATQNPASRAPSSATYTQGHSTAVVASHASRTVENSATFLLPHIKPNHAILDLGCGPGTITRGFCAHVPQGLVIGIDAADSVIAQARTQAPSAEFPNLSFQVGDITAHLPFEDNTIDVIYTSQTLVHIPSPVPVMEEAFRTLKPGGILAMRETDTLLWHPSNRGTEAYNTALGKAVPPGAQGFGSGRRLHIWAQQAGFERAKMNVGAGTMCYTAPEEARWWADVHIARLQGDVGKKWLDELGLVGEQKEIDEMIAGLKAWGDDPEAWFTGLQGEVICWK